MTENAISAPKTPVHWQIWQRKAVVNSPTPLEDCTGGIRHWNKDSGSRVAFMGKAKPIRIRLSWI